ncbi:MAG: asparaginase [Lachnospiraceae bacterium]|nr:asparaginase [Lachnospiraceae bacterium]
MKRILILMTGGTIASVPTEDGLMPASETVFKGFDYDITRKTLYPMGEFFDKEIALDWKEVFCLDSTNISPKEWAKLALEIQTALADTCYDGVVVTHGTDTMAYTMAGVFYMLSDVTKPVVFTGSQLPFDAPNTDGTKNLADAIGVACSNQKGIVLVFNGKIIDALCAKKVYSKKMAAFESINTEDVGEMDVCGNVVWKCRPSVSSKKGMLENASLNICGDDAINMVPLCIRLIPGMRGDLIDILVDSGHRAIILEAFGCGGVPHDLLPSIIHATNKRVIVCIISQCLYDGTDLSVYQVGIEAKKAGVISAGLMTVEALSAKIMWAFSQSDDYETVVNLLEQN